MRRWQVWFFGRWGQGLFWAVLLVAGWFLLGPGAGRWPGGWPFGRPAPSVVVAQPGGGAPGGWTAVARAVMPAVVNIASARSVRTPEQGPLAPFFTDPFFRYFFGGPETAPRRERSLGSGVLVTADGYVLTNHHVVEGAEDIRVTLADRREFQARLVGTDPRTDLAVLKLPGTGFPVVPLGDSARVAVAEVVLAVGNPFGLGQTVTMGIVSAVGRANVGIADYEDFIQTDAAINPGNSGGALVNTRGELIGINTAIFTQSGGSMGIGFAIPIDMARHVMEQLVTRGRVVRGYVGVAVQDLTPAMARALGLSDARGVLVADVVPDGPAAAAGLQRGDVIAAIDGRPVEDAGHFRNQVALTTPGARVRLTVVRQGRERALEVRVGELPEQRPAASRAVRETPDPLGLTVADLTPEGAARLGLPPGTRGALVTEVMPGGLAAEAGLRPGDVILEVNRRPVRSAREFVEAVRQSGRADLVLLVNRGGSTAFVLIERAA
jgi:serine protease Do